jgi:hypothetical protein
MINIVLRFLISAIIICLSCSEQKCDCIIPQSNHKYEFNAESINSQDFLDYWSKLDESLLPFQEYECYRLSYISPLDERIKIHRIQQTQNGFELHIKEYDFHSSNEGAILISNKEKKLSREEWLNLKKDFNKNCFWTMPINDNKNGLDGTVYRLEGFNPTGNICTNQKYHLVSRWSPDSTSFLKLCNRISELL